MTTPNVAQLLPGLFHFQDSCSVYVVCGKQESIAIDFGSGRWLEQFQQLDAPPIRHVFVTHHHVDQWDGLLRRRRWPFVIHAPVGEQALMEPDGVKTFWRTRRGGGVPASYSVVPRGYQAIRYDVGGFADWHWHDQRLRFLLTPGHGRYALSLLLDHQGKQVVFCGDAAHDGATVWQPYHLEWDHWTGQGALAAWEGVACLANVGMDLLCPSHGAVIATRPRALLKTLARRLMAFYQAKGSICPGEKDRYLHAKATPCGARQLLPNLFQFGVNAYLLRSDAGETLVLDVQGHELDPLRTLLGELGWPRLTAALATHYHCDHSDGLPMVKKHYGAKIHLHPQVAIALQGSGALDVPWLPPRAIKPDHLLPHNGTWRWNEYTFRTTPLPAQTWWHCGLMTTVNGQRVLFAGDNFPANSRWNATGGFCAFNGCRFREGFAASARRVIQFQPDILANGHGVYYRYHRAQFEKIIRWSAKAEAAVTALCPSGKLETDYYLHRWSSG